MQNNPTNRLLARELSQQKRYREAQACSYLAINVHFHRLVSKSQKEISQFFSLARPSSVNLTGLTQAEMEVKLKDDPNYQLALKWQAFNRNASNWAAESGKNHSSKFLDSQNPYRTPLSWPFKHTAPDSSLSFHTGSGNTNTNTTTTTTATAGNSEEASAESTATATQTIHYTPDPWDKAEHEAFKDEPEHAHAKWRLEFWPDEKHKEESANDYASQLQRDRKWLEQRL